MTVDNTEKYRGLFPACPTLLLDDATLDEDAQRRLYRLNADAGVSGFWMFGSGGEGLTLDDETRRRALEVLFDELGDDFPVIAGISAEGTHRVMQRWNAIKDLPIDAVFATPPIYYGYHQDELRHFFESLVDLTDRPVFVYHNPFFTKNRLTVDSVIALSNVPGIAGAKDSTNEIAETQRILWGTPENFVLFQGNEELIAASQAVGVESFVSVVSASEPELFVKAVGFGPDGDTVESMTVQREVNDYLDRIGVARAANEGEFVGSVKRELRRKGYGNAHLTAPWLGHVSG